MPSIVSFLRCKARRLLFLPFLPIILTPFILLSPVLLTGKAMYWGTPLMQFVPWWNYAWESLKAGHLPLWNPLLGMGAPFIANYQSALFYPPNWLYLLLASLGGTAALAWGQAFLVALHLAWAGVGMVLLTRRLGLGILSQTVSGVAFGLSGYIVSRSAFLSINAAVAWLPWILFCTTALIQDIPPSSFRQDKGNPASAPIPWKPFLGLAICLALQLLAGHAQTTWYTLLLAGMWLIFWGIFYTPLQTAFLSRVWLAARLVPIFGLAVISAVCLAAVQLLPTAEYLFQSQRSAAVDYEMAMSYSFWPWHLLTLFTPEIFGNPAVGDYWGYANYWEDAFYVGFLPAVFALAAIFRSLKRPRETASQSSDTPGTNRSLVLFLLALLGITLALALGRFTPVFPWLFEHVPTFSMFQAPARYLLWAVFALSLLAGIGIHSWSRPRGRLNHHLRLALLAAVGILVGATAGWIFLSEVSPSILRAVTLAGIWAVGTVMLALLTPPAGNRFQRWSWILASFVALDLVVANWGLNPGIDTALYTTPPANLTEVRALLDGNRVYLPAEDEEEIKYKRFHSFKTFQSQQPWSHLRATYLPDTNLFDSIPSANNFDPLLPGRYSIWIDRLEKTSPAGQVPVFDIMGVSVIENATQDQPFGVRFTPTPTAGRWRWIPCALPASSEQGALNRVFSGKIDFRTQVVLEGRFPATLSRCSRMETPEVKPAAITRIGDMQNPNRLDLKTITTTPGWLVVSDTVYPGWQAFIDGAPVEILPANYLFRAVPLPAGEHTVAFVYQPFAYLVGRWISFIALTALVAAGVLIWRTRI